MYHGTVDIGASDDAPLSSPDKLGHREMVGGEYKTVIYPVYGDNINLTLAWECKHSSPCATLLPDEESSSPDYFFLVEIATRYLKIFRISTAIFDAFSAPSKWQ